MSAGELDLACSANTLRHADLTTRVRAAATAGFTAIGLRLGDQDLPDRALRELLAAHGMRVLELEHTWDWAAPEPAPEETALFRLAELVGCRQLNVPMFFDHRTENLVEPFGALCDRAAEHGLLVGFEFIPYSHVRTLAEAWEVVGAAARPNGGVIIDLWHWFRSGATAAEVVTVPAAAVTSVQLSDVGPVGSADLRAEARHRRLLPGRGAGDSAAVLAALRGHGVTAPVSVEVFSDALDAMPSADAASVAFDTAAEVLAGFAPLGRVA
ncbi:sugar phosphate isomerase/epimerase family protein [Amycolatopsis rhabdoformis]|uniref:Sugar phosphate isomerase/epimerase family protein n=1 Tax=Amycolatopsis rhabdoformis TaxID=1448059 RepID=A0ABZ1II14_9PSEU|nr:sugar phosphate isomerase/epimerase family protein [Amycolatopsis rhabdoformis]WSE34066.1 sugar phosphate isomerase/epimerase family protein [Amycolatopsis rhabdoformis]